MTVPLRLTLNGNTFAGSDLAAEAGRLAKSDNPWEQDLGEFLLQWVLDRDSITAFTSGSTGPAKPLKLKKTAMIASAEATAEALGLKTGDQALLCLSAKTIAGMMMTVRSMHTGMNLLTVAPTGNPLKNLNENYRPVFAAMVPAQVFNSLNDAETRKRFRTIGTVIIGGGEISPQLEAMLGDMPNALYATYGMTETISHIALRRINGPQRSALFTALPGISLSTDRRGCLVIHAPRISEQPLITNDLAELTDNCSFKWLGRYDNIINRGGKKLIPEEIEKKLQPLIPQRFYIAARPDQKYGQVPVLVIESTEAVPDEDKTLLESFAQLCSHDELPTEIIRIPKFAETGSGKIKRERIEG